MRVSRGVIGLVVGALLLAGCGSAGPPEPATVTLYNAQHEDLAQEWVRDFTARTGIRVEVRNGDDSELANQIVQEGQASPADVFITENSPAMSLVSDRGLFAPVEPAALGQVPPQFRSAANDWVGIAARSTVLVYNPRLLPADQLPRSIMDLAGPQWQGRVGFPPGGADFQAIVSAVAATRGEAATGQWLQGLETNGRLYQSNTATMRAVNAGEIPAGIIYHYYWSKDRAEAGANSANAELHYFGNQDPGAFLSTSGGGVLRSSDTPREAQALVAYLNGPDGQRVLANSTALEYTVNPAVPSNPRLPPIAQLGAPPIDPNALDGPRTVQMMQQAGLL
ncbi:iron ABC transporter substrate-binding protein [Actinomycetospora sp. TBRC 11914]|nr:iron ABC transporter substrate-binding protein [Actinomycetospora sp. TBRC 11914]